MTNIEKINAIAAKAYALSATATTPDDRSIPLVAASSELIAMDLILGDRSHRDEVKMALDIANAEVFLPNFLHALKTLGEKLSNLGVAVDAANAYADNMPLVKISKGLKDVVSIKLATDKVVTSLQALKDSGTGDENDTTAAIDSAASAITDLQDVLTDLLKPDE